MSGFAQSNDPVPTSPRFRLVTTGDQGAPAAPEPPQGGLTSMVPRKLLVPEIEWHERRPHGTPVDRIHACADVPLIASLARIRSEADAALALTGVIELLARRFHITLPVGASPAGTFQFEVPENCNLSVMADTIDDSLLSVVRATDLQGAMRERVRARVERVER